MMRQITELNISTLYLFVPQCSKQPQSHSPQLGAAGQHLENMQDLRYTELREQRQASA